MSGSEGKRLALIGGLRVLWVLLFIALIVDVLKSPRQQGKAETQYEYRVGENDSGYIYSISDGQAILYSYGIKKSEKDEKIVAEEWTSVSGGAP